MDNVEDISSGPTMTVRQLIGKLMYEDPDKEVVLFASGDVYPACCVQDIGEYIEIRGGWVSVDSEEWIEHYKIVPAKTASTGRVF